MAEATHHQGGIVSVHANDDGRPECVCCHRTLENREMAMLLLWPERQAYDAWCPECATGVLRKAVSAMADDLGLGEVMSFIV
jgi:hypothetical protein